MAAKKGLGKGLDSLISGSNDYDLDVSRETIVSININSIEPNREQPRSKFEEDSLDELASSIKQHGVFQPLLVKKCPNDRYKIIAGERRWRAARIAGLKELPVVIKDYTPDQEFIIALLENIQREGLNSIEEAIAYQRLINEYHLKQDDIAEQVSKSRTAITNALRLLKLDKRVQDMIIEDMISAGHARPLLAIEDKEQQYKLAMQIFDEKLSVRDTEKLVRKIVSTKTVKERNTQIKVNDILYKNHIEKMKFALGSKVEVQNKENGKGKIVIEFNSNDDFERIYEVITGSNEQ